MNRDQLEIANELAERIDKYTRLVEMFSNETYNGTTWLQELEERGGSEIGDPYSIDNAMRTELHMAAFNLLEKVTKEFDEFLAPCQPCLRS